MIAAFPLIVGVGHILLFGAAAMLALSAAFLWTMHHAATDVQRARIRQTVPGAAKGLAAIRTQPANPSVFRTWSSRN